MAKTSHPTSTTIRHLKPDLQAVFRCGQTRPKMGQCQRNFSTTEYVMLYMVKGQAIYQDDQHAQLHLSAGMIWQRLPNRIHSVTCTQSCCWYFVAVPGPVVELFQIAGISTINSIAFHIGHHRNMIRRYEQIRKRLESQSHSQRPYCLMAMQQLMVDLHQLARQSPDHHEDWLDQTRDLLSQHLAKRIKTQQVAEQVGMTYASFRKHFAQATGMNPGQFRIRQRIERAQEQLASTQLPIAKIAASLGYPDVYNFTAQFTRYVGMAPGQYRKRWQWESQTP